MKGISMVKSVFPQILAILSLFALTHGGPTCLECTDAITTTDCNKVTVCGDHEQCYTDEYATTVGTVRYNAGCRDAAFCSSSKRHSMETESRRSSDGILVCSECCSGDLCNSALCRAQGYPDVRGPICYNCKEQFMPNGCNEITMCGQDQVCMLNASPNQVIHVTHYHSSCEPRKSCMFAMEIVGRKRGYGSTRSNDACRINCCEEDLCNNKCPGGIQNAGCEVQLEDGSFEAGTGWHSYRHGFTRQSGSAQDGQYYITVGNGGAFQVINFSRSYIMNFTLSGYSRSHSVTTFGSDYSIYCDITNMDGTKNRGTANFDATEGFWSKAMLFYYSPKVIHHAECYAMFRDETGSVDFDNFKLETCS